MTSERADKFGPAAETDAQASGVLGRTSAHIRGEAAAGPSSIWVVLDESCAPCYCHSDRYACEEHIFDAIREEIEEAAQWIIREFVQKRVEDRLARIACDTCAKEFDLYTEGTVDEEGTALCEHCAAERTAYELRHAHPAPPTTVAEYLRAKRRIA